jgi:Spy/CpxP family protein refolding chaperone
MLPAQAGTKERSMKTFSYILAALAAIAFAIPSIASAEDAKPMATPMEHHHHYHHHHHHHHGAMMKTDNKM